MLRPLTVICSSMTTQRLQNGSQNQQQRHSGNSEKPSSDLAEDLILEPMDGQLRPNVPKGNSADKVMLADRVAAERRTNLYAGPTFHNSPAPTCLPIPAFAKSWSNGNFATEPLVDNQPTTPFFGDGASPHLNSMRPQRTQSDTTGWTAYNSLPEMPSTVGLSFQQPDHVVTSSYVADVPASQGTDQLIDIGQNLRSLLKIQSQ